MPRHPSPRPVSVQVPSPHAVASAAAGFVMAAIALVVWALPTVAAAPQIERRVDRSFRVQAGSTVVVRISGGPITVDTGPAGTAQVTLEQRIDAPTDAAADDVLADFDVTVGQQGDVVTVAVGRRSVADDRFGVRRRGDRLRVTARLSVPAGVRLDLGTSGGSIAVRGDRAAPVRARTSGGSVTVDGGQGELDLDTSGGRIHVGRALGVLRAETSGGGISVDHVGRSATDVQLSTSGGGIRVNVDRGANLDVNASTSGGSVLVTGLPFTTQSVGRSRASGVINRGGGRLTARTSGGSIEIRAAP